MRSCFLKLILCWGLTLSGVAAQQPWYWNVSLGYGRGTHEDFRLSVDFVLPNRLTLSGMTGHLERTAPQKPADYRQGLCVWDNCEPRLQMNAYGILGGRAIALRPFLRLNLRGGLAVNTLEEPIHFQPNPPDPCNLASNYRYDKKHTVNAGFVVEPRLELMAAHTLGIALGGFAHINKTNPAFGVFLDLLGGWRLRNRQKGKPAGPQ